jgi:hypothetical protein
MTVFLMMESQAVEGINGKWQGTCIGVSGLSLLLISSYNPILNYQSWELHPNNLIKS